MTLLLLILFLLFSRSLCSEMLRELRSSSMHTPWNYTAAILLFGSLLTITWACVMTHSTSFNTPSSTGTVLCLMLIVEFVNSTGACDDEYEIGSTWCGIVMEFALYILLALWNSFYDYCSCASYSLFVMCFTSLLRFFTYTICILFLLLIVLLSCYLSTSYTYK